MASASRVRFLAPSAGKDHPELGKGGRFNKNTTEGQLLVYGDTLIQVYAKDVIALEVATGKLLWQIKTEFPVRRGAVSQDGKRLFIQEVTTAMKGYGRWGSYATETLVCVDMSDGSQVWRSTILAGERTIDGQRQTRQYCGRN